MTVEWKPTTDKINGVISSNCEFIKDEGNDLLEELMPSQIHSWDFEINSQRF